MGASVGKAAAALVAGSAVMVWVAMCLADQVEFINSCISCSLYILCRDISVSRRARGDAARARCVRGALSVAAILFMLASLAFTFSLVALPFAAGGDAHLWAIPATAIGCALRLASNVLDADPDSGNAA